MPLALTLPADEHGAEYIVRPGKLVTMPGGDVRRVWQLAYRAAPNLGAKVEGRIYLKLDATEKDAAERFRVLLRNHD